MANITLTVDDGILARARSKALEHGTSVNAVVRDYLARYAGTGEAEEAIRAFLELTERYSGSSGPEGRTWTREGLYER